jgi:iron(III) transport system substrate-binding protein
MVVLPSEDSVRRFWIADCGLRIGHFEISNLRFLIGYRLLTIAFLLLAATGCSNSNNIVVVYTSQDQVYAEPIFQDFTKETGIEVRAVYDSEAVKTVGLVNRLLAEKENPQCDVFWNNEELRTHQLEQKGLFRESAPWSPFGHRSRQLVINTSKLSQADAPKSWLELTNAIWRGKLALAYPLFGTTATHFLALREHLGAESWETWCRALAANDPFLVDGNSVVVKLVGRGEALIGMTDSDDIAAGQREGLPVAALPLLSGTLLIPNTVAVIRNAPHPDAAQRLYQFLQSEGVLRQLRTANAIEAEILVASLPEGLLQLNQRIVQDLEPATAKLKEIFLR